MEKQHAERPMVNIDPTSFSGTRPRAASPLERRKLREDLRDVDARLRALEQAEKEDR
jgi:hypothetical protein